MKGFVTNLKYLGVITHITKMSDFPIYLVPGFYLIEPAAFMNERT